MIDEDYCSYEVSKLLKEKGFDEECDWFYEEVGDLNRRTRNGCDKYINSLLDYGEYAVPTHQMAMKWLREVHKLHIEIDVYEDIKYAWSLSHADSGKYVIDPLKLRDKGYPTYEEAVEAALKYCLTKLKNKD